MKKPANARLAYLKDPQKGHFAGATRPVATGLVPSVYRQQTSLLKKKATTQ